MLVLGNLDIPKQLCAEYYKNKLTDCSKMIKYLDFQIAWNSIPYNTDYICSVIAVSKSFRTHFANNVFFLLQVRDSKVVACVKN